MDINLNENFDRTLDVFFEWLPIFAGALVILLVGYVVARVLQNLTARSLDRAGFAAMLARTPTGRFVAKAMDAPAHFAGRVVFWVVFVCAASIAATSLGIDGLTTFLDGAYSYLPNVLAAILIFLVASGISAGSVTLVNRVIGDTPTGKLASAVLPAITMGIAVFMILDQLKIAEDIVNITYTALVGSAALGMALAFGLGGRDVAAKMMEQAYARGQSSFAQAKRDVSVGKARAKTVRRKR